MRQTAWFVVLGIGLAVCVGGVGCTTLKTPAGSPLSLSEYDRIVVAPVEADPKVRYPEVAVQLTHFLSGRILSSPVWSAKGPALADPPPSGPSGEAGPRAIKLAVRLRDVCFPPGPERVLFGTAFTLKCHVDVFDAQTGALLGDADIEAGHDAGGGFFRAGVVGAIIACLTPDDTGRSLGVLGMAQEIVRVLERAKTYKPPAPGPERAEPPEPKPVKETKEPKQPEQSGKPKSASDASKPAAKPSSARPGPAAPADKAKDSEPAGGGGDTKPPVEPPAADPKALEVLGV